MEVLLVRNFVEFSGVSKAMFIFFFLPIFLTEDYRAPPIVSKTTYVLAWHGPNDVCFKNYNVSVDVSIYSLVGSPRFDVKGQNVTSLPIDYLGKIPYIHLVTKEEKHGGIPSLGDLYGHLEKSEHDILHLFPEDGLGLAVIDFDAWRPVWERNKINRIIYQKKTFDLVKKTNPDLPDEIARDVAKEEFEKKANEFMLKTLQLAQKLRPNIFGVFTIILIVTIIIILTTPTVEVALKTELVYTIGETLALGASGIVIWGSYRIAQSEVACRNLKTFERETLSPYLINVTLAAKMCHQALCQDRGFCMRKDWNSNDYLHLNPKNFVIKFAYCDQFIVYGEPSIEDLQQFSDKFDCACFANVTCKKNDEVEIVKNIRVCINEETCISVFVNPGEIHESTTEPKTTSTENASTAISITAPTTTNTTKTTALATPATKTTTAATTAITTPATTISTTTTTT